ncbi:MAG: transposase [Firmicutes bacterium]|nr:transposase [Bacillota bacterium]
MSRYCVTFPLITELYQDDILDKRFEISRSMYNGVLSKVFKRYKCMIETKIYRQLKQEISISDEDQRVILYMKLNAMYKEYRLNEYSLHEDIKEMQHHFKDNIDAFTAQKIATRVWKAMVDLLFGKGDTVHFKKYGELDSVEGKSNKTGIRYKDEVLSWNGLKIPVKIDYNNTYENRALEDEICYCRIKRKFVRGRYKYYLQITFKGVPPLKINKAGEIKKKIGIGTVGIDIGTQSIAIASDTEVSLLELADKVQNIENQKRVLQRYMDRSKRANSPENFQTDGTVKKGRLIWKYSNRYKKARFKLRDTYRKQADMRYYQHQMMSNYIISLGDKIYVEDMNFKALQKRSKKVEKNEDGKFKKRKRFGKSLGNKAPAKLLTILDNKLKYFGRELIKVNTREVKASQYNHLNGQYNKKKLSQRWNDLDGIKVQRDLYSAYLIQHVNDDLCSIDQEGCSRDFAKYLVLHDKEIKRLSNMELNTALKNVM